MERFDEQLGRAMHEVSKALNAPTQPKPLTTFRTSLTMYVGIVLLVVGIATAIHFHSWEWAVYGLLGMILVWGTIIFQGRRK